MSLNLKVCYSGLIGLAVLLSANFQSLAGPMHGIAMYGAPALPVGFKALPYVNENAPKRGKIVFGSGGSFDSLNPWILKGRAPSGIRAHMYESLMGRNWDEPFALYGLLAESIETDEDRSWVKFTLREEAAFSDGSPVTVEDVMWSFETLGTKGHPRYHTAWKKIESMERNGKRSITIVFNAVDRELPLILGLRPILKKDQWDERDFAQSSLDIPIATGPYVVDNFSTGRFLVLRRNPEYWGRDLALNRGRHNFDKIRYEYFSDGSVVFEAFKAGQITTFREWNAAKWDTSYNFPAIRNGETVKSIIPHKRPSGIEGFVFNTRTEKFADWRVRDALIHAFNFEFINNTLNGGIQPRITSYFSNSDLAMETGPATGKVRELLLVHEDALFPGALDEYSLPVSDGSERNRGNVQKALKILETAGWKIAKDGLLRNAAGAEFTFEILLRQGSQDTLAIANIFAESLRRIGIDARVVSVDNAQYRERTNVYDFEMTWYRRGMSLSPGNEQLLYWGSEGVAKPGTRNWMGAASPAIESAIDFMLKAKNNDDFVSAVKALDRLLTTGRYVIPTWYSNHSRIAHRKELRFPKRIPLYGDWLGFQPDVWWYEE